MASAIAIFAPDGRFHDGRSASLPDHLEASIRGEMLRAYVVRNMGYVAITDLGRSTLVQVRPSQVSMFAFGAALKWLSKGRAERFTIASFNRGQWHEQAFASRRDAVAHLTTAVFANDNFVAMLAVADDQLLRAAPDLNSTLPATHREHCTIGTESSRMPELGREGALIRGATC